MKNILITGGFGFLGTHLVEGLLGEGDNRIVVVDNLSSSPLPLEHLLDELGHSEELTYSLTSIAEFCRANGNQPFAEVYHLASVVGPAGVLPHAGRMAASIINDTLAVANLTIEHGARLLDVSTSEVYGGGNEGFCSEAMAKIVPAKVSARLEYAVGKLAAEVALLNLCGTGALDATIVRPFNISGPRQSGRGGFVMPRFVGQAMTGQDITVFGDGRQIRAFTHVKDMVAGIITAMRKGRAGEVYNLGNAANRCSILELAEEVKALTGSRSRITFVDPKAIYGPYYEEANNKFPDDTKTVKELGWKPCHDRHAAILDTYEYLKRLSLDLQAHLRGF